VVDPVHEWDDRGAADLLRRREPNSGVEHDRLRRHPEHFDLAAELRLGVDVNRERAKHDALDLDAAGIRPQRLRPDEQDDLAARPREGGRDQCADTAGA